MTRATQLYEDRWGEVIDRPDDGFVEIRWYDTNAESGCTTRAPPRVQLARRGRAGASVAGVARGAWTGGAARPRGWL